MHSKLSHLTTSLGDIDIETRVPTLLAPARRLYAATGGRRRRGVCRGAEKAVKILTADRLVRTEHDGRRIERRPAGRSSTPKYDALGSGNTGAKRWSTSQLPRPQA